MAVKYAYYFRGTFPGYRKQKMNERHKLLRKPWISLIIYPVFAVIVFVGIIGGVLSLFMPNISTSEYSSGNDHLGHGQSVTDSSEYGYFAKHDGNFCVLGDMQQLREDTVKKYPNVPYFILGHSRGSLLARQFIEKFGAGLKVAIIMGTGYQPNSTLDLAIGLTAVFQQARGGHYRSERSKGEKAWID